MKIINLTALSTLFILASACQKDKVLSRPVDFSSANYQSLGTYDASGKPGYLLTRDAVPTEMISYIKTTLVEKTDVRKTSPELLNNATKSDITITQSSDVFISFVYENTAYANALAFYTYPTNTPPQVGKDIKTITYIFPNAGEGTTLKAGDKVKIGRFEPGTTIGFVVLKGAWNSTTKTIDSKAEHYCTTDNLNPEVDSKLKRHSLILNYTNTNKALISFENTDRTTEKCDHDFNDVVFYATVTP